MHTTIFQSTSGRTTLSLTLISHTHTLHSLLSLSSPIHTHTSQNLVSHTHTTHTHHTHTHLSHTHLSLSSPMHTHTSQNLVSNTHLTHTSHTHLTHTSLTPIPLITSFLTPTTHTYCTCEHIHIRVGWYIRHYCSSNQNVSICSYVHMHTGNHTNPINANKYV